MNPIGKLGTALSAARHAWRIGTPGGVVVMSESDLLALANEDPGMRALGMSSSDLPAYSHERMQKVALHLYRNNHMAKRLLEIIVDFALGDGLSVTAKHENEDTQKAIQACIDDFWNDPINDMERMNPQRLTELNLWGEVLMPAMVNEITKRVRIGWIDPACMAEIEPDAVTKRPGRVKLTSEAAREVGSEWLDVIRYSHADGVIVGNCFYYQINSVMNARRGISEFFTSADWFDVMDESMKTASDRAKVLLEFIWDVELQGADEATIQKFAKAQRRPKPGSLRVHNEKVKWSAQAPQLAAYEMSRQIKDLKTYILGGFGYPNHWFGSGDDANLATAEMMSEPTRKALKRKTSQFRYLLKDIIRFVLVKAAEPGGMLAGADDFDPMADCFEVSVPDIGGTDVAKIGSAMQTGATAIAAALQAELIAEDTARELFAAFASLLGSEIDPAKEAEKIKTAGEENAKAQNEKDLAMQDQIQKGLAAMQPKGPPSGAGDNQPPE